MILLSSCACTRNGPSERQTESGNYESHEAFFLPSLSPLRRVEREGFREGENCPWGNRETVGNGSNERAAAESIELEQNEEAGNKRANPNGTVGSGH